jgi:carbon monoxide dehydrogenase subunit G
MEFSGTHLIAASREQVWQCLNDGAILKVCVPGCESFESVGEDRFDAVVVAAVGPVKARFKGNLVLSDRDEPNSYRITGQGEGGVAGFGKMTAAVTLSAADDGGTSLHFTAQAQVGGKLAQIGARLVTGVANKMVAEFFTRFTAAVSADVSDTSAQ